MSKFNFKLINLLPYLTLVWLSAICLAYLLFFNSPTVKDADLVFCPLQKIWVQKNPQLKKVKSSEPLDEICASDNQKENFIFESFQKLTLNRVSLDANNAEKLFFDYAEKGKDVFDTFSNSHSLPETQLTKAINTENVVFNLQKEFLKKETGISLLSNQPRPPNFQIAANFASQKFVSLKNISRKISPRAPPILL